MTRRERLTKIVNNVPTPHRLLSTLDSLYAAKERTLTLELKERLDNRR